MLVGLGTVAAALVIAILMYRSGKLAILEPRQLDAAVVWSGQPAARCTLLMIGDSHVMLSAQSVEPEKTAGGDPRGNGLGLKIYVDEVDEVFHRAIGAGATQEEPVQDHFFGERSGEVTDPFGFTWRLAQLLEEVPHEEIERRMRERAN